MPPARKSPADKALRSIGQAIQAHVSGLSADDKQLVAQGLRRAAERLEGQAQERVSRYQELTRAHLEKLLVCGEFLKARHIEFSITQANGQMPVLVAGPLKIAYNDESGRFISDIGGFHDSAFSHEALCLTAIERLKGQR